MQRFNFWAGLGMFLLIGSNVGFAEPVTMTSKKPPQQMIKVQWSELSGQVGEMRWYDNAASGVFLEKTTCPDSASCALLHLTASPFSNSGSVNFRLEYEQSCVAMDIKIPFTVQNGKIETPVTSYPVDFVCGGAYKADAPRFLTVSGNAKSGYIITYS